MTKSSSLKFGMVLLFLVSVVCAIIIQLEPLRFIFTAVAFLMLGFYNTIEHRTDKKKGSLYFSVMLYCFSLSAMAFAGMSMIIG